jgi:hypothetical protein
MASAVAGARALSPAALAERLALLFEHTLSITWEMDALTGEAVFDADWAALGGIRDGAAVPYPPPAPVRVARGPADWVSRPCGFKQARQVAD